jgi:PIN domain nuclease of toxin-antitoxin system
MGWANVGTPAFTVIEALNSEDAIASTQQPGDFHKDPADRIIVAMVRRYDVSLITCDSNILKYPHLKTIW